MADHQPTVPKENLQKMTDDEIKAIGGGGMRKETKRLIIWTFKE